MDLAIQLCSYLVGIPLELLTIGAMLRGGFKHYPLLFAYVIAFFLTTVVEIPSSVAYYAHPESREAARAYAWWYWRDEILLQLLVFAVVISLIYYATARMKPRRTLRLAIIGGALLVAGISFLWEYHSKPNGFYGLWFTSLTRDLNFCAAILDLTLWGILVSSRHRDQQVLMLSCGLGIMFAGEAIGESVRNLAIASLSHGVALVGGLLVQLANLAFLYIWWRAFQRKPDPRPTQ
jgi:hypothetical protein